MNMMKIWTDHAEALNQLADAYIAVNRTVEEVVATRAKARACENAGARVLEHEIESHR
jgi:hypothetical protein